MANFISRSSMTALGILLFSFGPLQAGNWPQWRGPTGDSVSDETGLPLRWNDNQNVVWKCPLPEEGASTPAIWGDSIFLTTQRDQELLLLRIDKNSGRVTWSKQVGAGTANRAPLKAKKDEARRHQKFHQLHNMASPSPVTDGERVIAHFGNGDLAAFDFAGNALWQRNLQKDHGEFTIWWGHANSPVLHENLVIIPCMQDSLADLPGKPSPSYLVAYDKKTGKEKWKTMRMTAAKAEECDSYTTPVFQQVNDRLEMIVMGGNQIDAYDPATGKQLWKLPGIVGGRTITGPTVAAGHVFATQGMRGNILAVPLGRDGSLTDKDVSWKHRQGTPDTCCPVAWKDWLFTVSDDGVAQCFDVKTGKVQWNERLPGAKNYKASPVVAEGRIYFLNLSGVCTVVAAAPKFEILATNRIADETIASPALSDGRIYLRGKKALYCIGTPAKSAAPNGN